MTVSFGDISKLLGALGTAAGILGGVAAIVPYLQPKPTVQMWIEKAQLSGIPATGSGQNSVPEKQKDFGAVTVAIRNNSPNSIDQPTLRFRYLRNFKGIVIADGILDPGEARKIEREWNKKIASYPDDTTVELPRLNPGAGITVQAFGSDWKYVDPEFTGVADARKTWIIAVADSRIHTYLFEYHLWILSLVTFMAGCALLAWGRPSGSASALQGS